MSKWIAIAGLVSLLFANVAAAAEDPTGTWKWSAEAGGQTREFTLKLKLEGDKLTGAMVGRNNQETPIEEASFKDNVATFKVTRERNGQKFTSKYTATVSGDTLKGKSEFERDGQTQTREFEAKRQK
jgi:hypothetical protein